MKLHIRTGDQVKVMRGNARGAKGKVKSVNPKKYRAIVEGINLRIIHIKPNKKNPKGKRIKKESSIHLSNLMLIDPETQNPTRITRKINPKTKKLQRYTTKTNNPI